MSKKVKFSKPSGPFSEPYTGKISSKVDPIYDDVDIFEGGPAGQVLVDIDQLYGGIQLQEDELPGSQAMRDLARAGKEITDVFTPSEETKAEIEERDRKEQEAFALLLKATGVEPETFEAGQLEGKLRRDAELRKLLNLPTGFFDRGLTDLRLGFATAGQFLFGEANKGLTTMTEEGTKFKDLPFDQQLGIVILPIDLLDAVGITYGGAQVLKTLIKGGVKQYGKKSGKTVKDLLETSPELYKDLLFTDKDKRVWAPATITIPEKGMVFADGTSKDDWKWTAVNAIEIPKEELEKYPKGQTHRMDMKNPYKFDKLSIRTGA